MDGPQQGMPPGASPVGAEQYRTVTGAATAATVLILLVLVGDVLISVSDWRTYLVVRDYMAGAATIADLEAADAFSALVSIPALLVAIAAGVVFLVWLWRVRINAELVGGPAAHRRSRRWVGAGWITPVVSLWFPYQVVADIWQASAPRRPATGGLIIAWWVLFVANVIISQVLLRFYLRDEITEQELLTVANLSVVSTVLHLAAGVLIILIIKRITAWQSQPRNVVGTDHQGEFSPGEHPPMR